MALVLLVSYESWSRQNAVQRPWIISAHMLAGPTLVSPKLIPDPSKLRVRGLSNDGSALQECGTDDLIFSIPKIISFLSQSTTLPPGTVIITGTPAGVGFAKKPKYTLKPGEEFRVEILPYIGTLINVFEAEQ